MTAKLTAQKQNPTTTLPEQDSTTSECTYDDDEVVIDLCSCKSLLRKTRKTGKQVKVDVSSHGSFEMSLKPF